MIDSPQRWVSRWSSPAPLPQQQPETEADMANEFVVIFDDVKTWFAKVFKAAPKAAAAALAVLNTAAPLFEAVIAVVDPAVAVVVDPIVTIVQADMGTVASMLQNNQITNIGTFLTSIKNNFSTLLTEAHITDEASVAKANVFLSVIQSIASDLGVTL
jgi:hypothetical protein